MRYCTRILAILVLLAASQTLSAQVSFPNFCSVSGLTLNGVTSSLTPNADCTLRLTDDLGQSGSAFVTTPISLSADVSFSTAFSFQFTNPKNGGADGIVFVVQTVANNVGGGGGGIGYSGITNSVGVEFDTWNNGGGDNNNASHVGIDLNGSLTSVVLVPVTPALDNGDVWYAWVDYNGATDELEVYLSSTSSRPASPVLTHNVDLVSVLGQTDAYVGFTSGTGAASNVHDVRSWQFVDDYAPIDTVRVVRATAVPALNNIGMMILLALTALIAYRRFLH